jgi:hypothetical protein
MNNVHKSGGRLKTSKGVPTWAPDGNQTTTHSEHFPLTITDPHYNMLYATLSEPDWPVPRPLTDPSDIGIAYTASVGDIARTLNFTNTTDTANNYLICIDPTSGYPVTIYEATDTSGAMYLNTAAGLVFNASSVAQPYGRMFSVPFVQTDPRVLIQGAGNIFGADSVSLASVKKFQAMGGKIDISLSVAWNNSAQVGICDPLLAPNRFGNKMPSFHPTPTSTFQPTARFAQLQREERQYYVSDGQTGDGQVVRSHFQSTNMLASRKVQLVGGGNSSRLNLTTRYVPNTQTWVVSNDFSPPALDVDIGNSAVLDNYPSAFSGNGMVTIVVPPNSGIIIDISGWLSYNIEVMPGLAAGNLMALECPLAVGHMSDVVNVPMTFGVSFDSARVADNNLTTTYCTHPIPTRMSLSSGVQPKPADRAGSSDIQTVLNKFRPLVSTLGPKLVSGFKQLAQQGIGLLGPMVANLARRLPGVAVKAAPLLLA